MHHLMGRSVFGRKVMTESRYPTGSISRAPGVPATSGWNVASIFGVRGCTAKTTGISRLIIWTHRKI